MDFSKFKTNDWLIVGGGIGMLIFGSFVKWQKVSVAGFSSSGGTAFDFFFTGTIPWILLIGAAVVTVMSVQGKLGGSMQWPMIVALATIVAAVLLLIRFLFNPGAPDGISRGMGLILSFVSGIVAAVGGVMNFTAGGGDLSDLADVNKLKDAFTGDDDDAS